ncbi:MAG TPA: helicase-associated domain-containing protein [Limnochordales bacterium]
MRYRQLTGQEPPAALDGETYRALSLPAQTALLALLFSRASLPAPELAGAGADQVVARVAALVGGKQAALEALWEARRAGLAVLMRERRYDLYLLPDESRQILWNIGARDLRSRRPPITFVVETAFGQERFDAAGVEAASALLFDLAAVIAFVRAEEAPLGPGGHLQRRAQHRLTEYLSLKEPLAPDTGPFAPEPPRMGFLLDLAKRIGLVQVAPGDGEFLQEGPLADAWLQAGPGRRLARVMAGFCAMAGGSEVDALIALDASRWVAAPGRGVWVKGFAEAISHFEDEPFPAYRLVSLIKTLQRLAWMGAVFMWRARWHEPPPESGEAGNVSVKPAPSQRKGLPPLSDVAFGITAIGRVLWDALSDPRAMLEAARLDEDADAEPPVVSNGARPGRLAALDGGTTVDQHETAAPAVSIDQRLAQLLPEDEAHAFIQPNFEILAPRHMRPDRLARLMEISEVVRSDRMVQLRLDVERAAAAVRSGRWAPAEVVGLLREASRHELPQNVQFTLVDALKPLGRVQLMDGILVRTDDATVASALLEGARARGIPIDRVAPEALWIERRHVSALLEAAERCGYPVRPWVKGTRVAYPAQRADEVGQALESAARQAAREAGVLVERRPPPSLTRGRRDLTFVPPGSEADLLEAADRTPGLSASSRSRRGE